MVKDNVKTKAISSIWWKLLERCGSFLVSLIVQIMLARLLAPGLFGELAIIMVLVNIGNQFVVSGLNTALVQSAEASDDDYSTVFWMCLVVALVLFLIVFAVAPFVAAFYQMDGLIWPLRVMAILFIINAFNSVQIASMQKALEFKKQFISSLSAVFISGIAGVSCAIGGLGLWALVVQQLTCQIVNCAVLATMVAWKPNRVFNPDRAKGFLSYGWKLLAGGLLDTFFASLTDLVIGKVFSSVDLGFYSQGKKYPEAVAGVLNGTIQPVMLAVIAAIQEDVGLVKGAARRAIKTSTLVVVPAMLAFALCAEPLIRFLLGEQWLPSVPFLQIFCLIFTMLPLNATNIQVLNGVGRSDLYLIVNVIKKVVSVALLLVAVICFKTVYAIALCSLIDNVFTTIINAIPNKKVIGYSLSEQFLDVLPAYALAIPAGCCSFLISKLVLPDALMIILQICVFFVGYFLLARLFRIESYMYLKEYFIGLLHAKRKAG